MASFDGYSGPLTDKQKATLAEFRTAIADLIKERPKLDNDEDLLRWIRAREWNVKKAEKMIRDSMAWRKSFGTDRLLTEYKVPEVMKKYSAGNFYGVDKQGYPIWYELLGYWDAHGIARSITKPDIVRYRMYKMEHLIQNIFPECSKKAGKTIDKCSMIFDLDGVGLKHISSPLATVALELLVLSEAHYPESLWHCYIINAPSVLPVLYNAAKPFLAEYTRSKIHFLSSNWKEELLQYIDADQLPVHWGGTATDPDGDPRCKSQICLGGTIPESYYLKNIAADKLDLDKFTSVTISHGQSLQLKYKVNTAGSILRWNFWTDSKDLAFGLFRMTSEGQKVEDMETVVPTSRVSCDIVPENGCHVCEKTGTYVIRFDNTYSWINSKKLSYLIDVLPPEGDTCIAQKADDVTVF